MDTNAAPPTAPPDLVGQSKAIKDRLSALVKRAEKASEDARKLRDRAQKIVQLRQDCAQLVTLESPELQVLTREAAAHNERQAGTINGLRTGMNDERELSLAVGEALERRWDDLDSLAAQEIDLWQQAIAEMTNLDEKARVELRTRIEQGEERWGTKRRANQAAAEKPPT